VQKISLFVLQEQRSNNKANVPTLRVLLHAHLE
jgi:hypothetical protein